ncbi:MAG: peptidoglycan recognition family protein [Elusimicrobiota bacterium]
MASSLRTLLVALLLLPCPLAGEEGSGTSSQPQQPPPKQETGDTKQPPPPEQKQPPARMPTEITLSVLKRADKDKEKGLDVKLEGLEKVNVRVKGTLQDLKKATQVRVVVRPAEKTPEAEAAALKKLDSELGKDTAVILTVDAAKAMAVDYDGWGSSGLAALQQAVEAVADAAGKDEFRLSVTGPVADYLARNYENDNPRTWEAWQRSAQVTDFVNQYVNDLNIKDPKGLTPGKMESFDENNVSVSFLREGGDIHQLDAKNVKGIIDSMPRKLSERERPKAPDVDGLLARASLGQAPIPSKAPAPLAYQPAKGMGERVQDALNNARSVPRAEHESLHHTLPKAPPAPRADGTPSGAVVGPRKLPVQPPAPEQAPAAPKVDREAKYSMEFKPGQKLTPEQAEQLIGSAVEKVTGGKPSIIRGSPVETGADGVKRLSIQTPQGTAGFVQQKNGEWQYEGRGMKLTHEGFGAWSSEGPTPPADLQKVVSEIDPTGKTRVQMGEKGDWNELADPKHGLLKFKDQAALEAHLAAVASLKAGKVQLPESLPRNVQDLVKLANTRLPADKKVSVIPAGAAHDGSPLYLLASGGETKLSSTPFNDLREMTPAAPPVQKPVSEQFTKQLKSVDAKVGLSKLVASRLGVSEQDAQSRLEAGLQKHGGDLDAALQEVAGKKFSEIGLDYAQQAKVDPAERLGFKDRAALESEMNRLRSSSDPADKKTLAKYEGMLKAHQTVTELSAPKPAPPAQPARPAVPLPAGVKEFLKGQNMSDEAVLKALQGEGLKVPASALFGDKTRSGSVYLKAVGDVNGRLAKVVVSFHGDAQANVAGSWGRGDAEASAKDIPKGSYALILSPQGDWQKTPASASAGEAYLDGAARVAAALGHPQAETVLIAQSGGGTQILGATDYLATAKRFGDLISQAQSQQDLDGIVAKAQVAKLIGKSQGLQELKDYVAKADAHAKRIERIVDAEAVRSWSDQTRRDNFISVLKGYPHIKADFYHSLGSSNEYHYDYQREFQSSISKEFGGKGFDNGGSAGKDTDRLRFRASSSHGQVYKDGFRHMFENLSFDGSGLQAAQAEPVPAPAAPLPSIVPPAAAPGAPVLKPSHIGPASAVGPDGKKLDKGAYHKITGMRGVSGMYVREFKSGPDASGAEPVRIVVTHLHGMSGGAAAYAGARDPKKDQSPLLDKAHQALAEQESKRLGKPVVVEARYLVANTAPYQNQSHPDNWHAYKNDQTGYAGVELVLHGMSSTVGPDKTSYFSGAYSAASSRNNAVTNGLNGKLDIPKSLMGNREMLASLSQTHPDAQTREAAQRILGRLSELEKGGGDLSAHDKQLGQAVKGLMERYSKLYLEGGVQYRADAMYSPGTDIAADFGLAQKMKEMGVHMAFTYGANPTHGSPRPMDHLSALTNRLMSENLPQKLQAAERQTQGLRDQITQLQRQGGSPEQIAKLQSQVQQILQKDGITELTPWGDGSGQGRLQISRQLGSVTMSAFLVKGHNDAFHGRASAGASAGDALLQAFKGSGVNQSPLSRKVGEGYSEPAWLTKLLAGTFDGDKPRDALAALPVPGVPAGAPVAPKPAPEAAAPAAPAKRPPFVDFGALSKEEQEKILNRYPKEMQERIQRLRDDPRTDIVSKELAKAMAKVPAETRAMRDQYYFKKALEAAPKDQPLIWYGVQYHEGSEPKLTDNIVATREGVVLYRFATAGSLPFANDAPRDPAPLLQQRENLQAQIAKLEQQGGHEAQVERLKAQVSALAPKIEAASVGVTYFTNIERDGQPGTGSSRDPGWINHHIDQKVMMHNYTPGKGALKVDPESGRLVADPKHQGDYDRGQNRPYDIHPGKLGSHGCRPGKGQMINDHSANWDWTIARTDIRGGQGELLGKTATFFLSAYEHQDAATMRSYLASQGFFDGAAPRPEAAAAPVGGPLPSIKPGQGPATTPPPGPVPLRQPVAKPDMVSRKDWRAAEADTDSMTRQKEIKHITIHHTGERQKPKTSIEQKMRGLQSFSQGEKGWGDVPYHYYIGSDGKIAEGRSVDYAGDSNTKYDTSGHVQVVLEGNFTKEKPSAEQLKSLGQLTSWLADSHRIPVSEIKTHGDYAKTECPGKALAEHIPALRSEVGSALDGTMERLMRVLPELFDGSLRPEGPALQPGRAVMPDASRFQTVGKAETKELAIGGKAYTETRQTYKVDGVKLNVISLIPKEGFTRLDSVNTWVHGRSSQDLRSDTSGAREAVMKSLKAGEGAIFVYPKSAGEAWPEFVKSYMGSAGQENGDKAKVFVDAFYHLTKDAPNKDTAFTMSVLSAGGIVGGATMRHLTSLYGKDPTVTAFVNDHFRGFTDGDSAAAALQVRLYADAAKLFDGLKLPVSMRFVHSTDGVETDFGNYSAHPLHRELVDALRKDGAQVEGTLKSRGDDAVVKMPNGMRIDFTSEESHYGAWKKHLASSVQTASAAAVQYAKASVPLMETATRMTKVLMEGLW